MPQLLRIYLLNGWHNFQGTYSSLTPSAVSALFIQTGCIFSDLFIRVNQLFHDSTNVSLNWTEKSFYVFQFGSIPLIIKSFAL